VSSAPPMNHAHLLSRPFSPPRSGYVHTSFSVLQSCRELNAFRWIIIQVVIKSLEVHPTCDSVFSLAKTKLVFETKINVFVNYNGY